MKVILELVIVCASPKEAISLQRTLAPDNRSIPKDQSFSSVIDGRNLRFLIGSARASGGLSSASSILTDVRLFQDVWSLTA